MATPGLPLPLRNALAELAIAALADDTARDAIAWLVAPGVPLDLVVARRLAAVHLIEPGGAALLDVHVPHATAVRTHAIRAARAAEAYRRAAPPDDVASTAVAQAAALWDEHLFFEVHEVLEAVWKHAVGEPRQALQGVIQIAVAFHHLAHGNPRGARTLMREGRSRLASAAAALPALDAGALLDATESWETALLASAALPSAPPRLPRR